MCAAQTLSGNRIRKMKEELAAGRMEATASNHSFCLVRLRAAPPCWTENLCGKLADLTKIKNMTNGKQLQTSHAKNLGRSQRLPRGRRKDTRTRQQHRANN